MLRDSNFACASCGRIATRISYDEDGLILPLCPRCPSPEEIRHYTDEIRSRWAPRELLARVVQKSPRVHFGEMVPGMRACGNQD